MEPQDIKEEIEAVKRELCRLIDIEAGFKEIYKTSIRLDKLIVNFYKHSMEKSILM